MRQPVHGLHAAAMEKLHPGLLKKHRTRSMKAYESGPMQGKHTNILGVKCNVGRLVIFYEHIMEGLDQKVMDGKWKMIRLHGKDNKNLGCR